MKYILSLLFILVVGTSFGQFSAQTFSIPRHDTIIYGDLIMHGIRAVQSRVDTTVLFNGLEESNHVHQYVAEQKEMPYETLAIWCGDFGCPQDWLDEKQICEICLRHIHLKETRWYEDKYTKALERLKKIQDK